MDPLTITCPTCKRGPGAECIALDFRPLGDSHDERRAALESTPLYDQLATA